MDGQIDRQIDRQIDNSLRSTLEDLATDSKKTDWTIAFDVLLVAIFKRSGQCFTFEAMFEYFEKGFNFSNGGLCQHANTDYIMTMNFIRINFSGDFSNIILRDFNVCQVLIVNGIS